MECPPVLKPAARRRREEQGSQEPHMQRKHQALEGTVCVLGGGLGTYTALVPTLKAHLGPFAFLQNKKKRKRKEKKEMLAVTSHSRRMD